MICMPYMQCHYYKATPPQYTRTTINYEIIASVIGLFLGLFTAKNNITNHSALANTGYEIIA